MLIQGAATSISITSTGGSARTANAIDFGAGGIGSGIGSITSALINSTAAVRVVLNQAAGNAIVTTGAGNHTVSAGIAAIAVSINGSAGTGAQTFVGNTAADVIIGGTGNDTITGANAADVLTGGTGVDQFSFAAGSSGGADNAAVADVITDFLAGTDKIQFTGVADVVSVQQAAVQLAVTALAAGSTDAQIATAMALASTTNLGVSFAVFNGNSYGLFETTGADANYVLATDVFIKFNGLAVAPIFANDIVA